MKKILITLFALMPMFGMAQSVKELTPEQKLEQAQKQLEEAQKAVAAAKANAEKAKKAAEDAAKKKAEEEAKAAAKKAADEAKAKEIAAKQAAIQEQIKKAQEEAARLNAEAERLKAEAEAAGVPATTTPAKTVEAATPVKTADVKPAETAAPATPTVSYTNKSGWNSPAVTSAMKKAAAKKMEKTTVSLDGYLAGAVTTVNDKVVFALDLEVPGKSAKAIFDTTIEYFSYLITDENQRENETPPSNISLVNESEHTIAARMSEWLVFNSSFISLDRSEFNYTLIAKCADNSLHLTLERISYNYEEGRSTGFKASAEEVICDKESLNKAQTKLVKPYGKFRKATIDRKNEIFEGLKLALK